MIQRDISAVDVGSFVRVADQFAHERYRHMWWKVTEVGSDFVKLINRHGHTDIWLGRHGISRSLIVWEPGDNNNDD